MKRVLFLAIIILFAAGLVYAETSIKPITLDDLKDLKGAWTGHITDKGFRGTVFLKKVQE